MRGQMRELPARFAARAQVRLQEGHDIVLPDGNALSRENEMPWRNLTGIVGRSERRIDDGFFWSASSTHRVADSGHRFGRGVVFGVHTENGDFDFSGRRRQGIL